MPDDLRHACMQFEAFYKARHSGQRLDWRITLGKAEIEVHFSPSVRRVLVASPLQMLVMLLFNEHECLNVQQIRERLGAH